MNRLTYRRLAYQKATGETGDELAESDEAYIILNEQANALIGDWQNAVDDSGEEVDWNSLWGRLTLAVPVTATDTFAIDRTVVRKLSTEEEGFKLKLPDGRYKCFTVVKPSELSKGGDRVALVGTNVVFAEAFEADDDFIGADISVAFFGFATEMADDDSVVPVDDPMWLVFRGAAELARNDFIKGTQSPGLMSQAEERMQKMISANRRTTGNNSVDHGVVSPFGYI